LFAVATIRVLDSLIVAATKVLLFGDWTTGWILNQ